MTSQVAGRLSRRFSWGLADQVVASGSNFATAILLARVLSLHDFGVYSMLWLVFLFIQSLQIALVISPMMVLSQKLGALESDPYFAGVAGHQMHFVLAAFTLATIGGLLALDTPVLAAGLGLWVASQLLCEYMRRYQFARGDLRRACLGDVLRYGSQMVLLVAAAIVAPGSLSLLMALGLITAGTLVGYVFLARGAPRARLGLSASTDVARRHLPISKWLLGSALVQSLWGGNLVTFVAGLLLSPVAVAGMRAAITLLGASNILLQSLENVALPTAARILHRDGNRGLDRYALRLAMLAVGGTGAVSLVMVLAAPQLLTVVFGEEYRDYAWVLRWLAIGYVGISATIALRIPLVARERTRPVFAALALGAGLTVIGVYPLITQLQLPGAVAAIVIAECAVPLALLWASLRGRRAGTHG